MRRLRALGCVCLRQPLEGRRRLYLQDVRGCAPECAGKAMTRNLYKYTVITLTVLAWGWIIATVVTG